VKQLSVFARYSLIPVSKRFPFRLAVGRRPKDVALAGEDEIGMNGKIQIGQAGFQQIDRTASVDRPGRALFLQAGNVLEAVAVEHGLAAMGDERAVKISADKANRGHAEAVNLETDSAAAIELLSCACWRSPSGYNRRVKSAYELAMERLEKKTPSVALSQEQKSQIAEIDSTFKARIAERELFLKAEMAKAAEAGNVEEAASLQKQLAIDIRRLQEDAEARKEKLRASFAG